MLRDVRITLKFPLVMICFALLAALVTGTVAYLQATSALYDGAKSHLYALLESREQTLARYFGDVESELIFHAQSPLIRSSFNDFNVAWKDIEGNRSQYLQKKYITDNPFSAGQKNKYLSAVDGSAYSNVHRKYHPIFNTLIVTANFYDIFLIDVEGNIVYTALKENDFATNVLETDRPTGLGIAFKLAIERQNNLEPSFSDFLPYAPSGNEPAGFISKAVFDEKGELLGVLAFQISIDLINSIMHVTAGMGESGETYLVGPGKLMRSDSRFVSNSILRRTVDTASVRAALGGEEGVHITPDYRGISVYSAYKPLDVMGVRWAVLAEIDEAEVVEPVGQLSRYLGVIGVALGLLIAVLGYLLATDLSSPIMSMVRTMQRLAANDLSTNVAVSDRKDEVGLMARALINLKEFATDREQLRQQLFYMANHDGLTDLPNRQSALTHIGQAVAEAREGEGREVSILFCDLDGFKQANDKLGHDFGDEVLKTIGKRFKSCLDENDFLARLGGDEFLIVLQHRQGERKPAETANALISSLGLPFGQDGHPIRLGVSIGIAVFPEDATKVTNLLKLADSAMYLAKAQGKNRYAFASELKQVELIGS
ncbi:diguanylate cyclase domain-containing protein [Roseibium sediminis]|uniref:diguanylate cyclase domain-containing protein n=1 Tax=Roseibium sediminis TaxID=1775174 RepID=UPI00123E4011|nr:diguanylate cyclase [Roseibium sediminis]